MKILRDLPSLPTLAATLLILGAVVMPTSPVRAASSPLRVEDVQLETRSAGPSLESALRGLAETNDDLWIGYAVPSRPGDFRMCCGSHWKRREYHGVCQLENRQRGFIFSEEDSTPIHLEGDPSPEIHVLIRLAGDRIDRVSTFSEGCPLHAGGLKLVWLEDVASRQSVEMLDALVGGGGPLGSTDRDIRDDAMAAMAFHAEPAVTAALEGHARTSQDSDLREEAIFWLGEARDRPGYEALLRLSRDLGESDLREHITFALSQSPVPEAEQALVDMARKDRDPDVRSQALFWLGQEGGSKAAETILTATREDPDEDVREEAVFALSQLPDGHGVERLLAIARDGSYPADVRKQALFWLGQSEDPRALDLLAELLQ